MNYPSQRLQVGPSALAEAQDFELGRLSVSPSQLEIRVGERRDAVQPRVMQVLVVLAGADGAVVSRDELVRQCWGGRAVSEDAINRCIAGVRRLGEAGGDFSITTIRRVGYRLERNSAAAHAGADGRTNPVKIVLAVLAFDNLSGDPDMVYFSDGVSEEILQTVSRGAGMKVIGRGSSFQFRGADKAAANVASVLRATHILDGSVRRSGARVRISANLVECAGETTLWSQQFDRELSDVFALQDEIASAVAEALKVAFASRGQNDAIDPAAYDVYLKALEIRNRGLEGTGRLAVIKLLEEATGLAPDFARAWVFLATMQVAHLRFGDLERPRRVTWEQVVVSARTALRLDPGLGGAYQALGHLEPFAGYAARETLNRKALSVSPNDPTVLTNASLFFVSVGRIDEAMEYAAQAYKLEPMYPWAANWYANMLDYTGRLDEGRALWKDLRALWPDNELICWNAVAAAAARCEWAWFDELAAAAEKQKFDSSLMRAHIAYGVGLRTPDADMQARALNRARERLRQTNTLPLPTFMFLHRLGLPEEAFQLIEQASFAFMFDPDRRASSGTMNDGSIFAAVHNGAMMRDVRFVQLCAKLGLCDYWVKTDLWPDCADAVAPHYDFKAEARRLASA